MPTYLEGEKKWKFWLTVIKLVVGLGLSIYSFATTVRSFSFLDDIRVEYGDLIDHWTREPLQDMVLVAADASCPAGYSEGTAAATDDLGGVAQTVGVWPGTNNWCDCPSAGATHSFQVTVRSCDCSGRDASSSSSRSCSSSQREAGCRDNSRLETRTQNFRTGSGTCARNATIAGCRNDNGVAAVPLSRWKGRRMCYQVGGDSPIDRPQIMPNGECPAGSVKCGTGTYAANNATCQRSLEDCPVTDISDFPSMANNSDFFVRTATNQQAAGLPIVEVFMTIGRRCQRGVEGDPGRSSNPREKDDMKDQCEIVDTRYEVWDSISEAELFAENNVPSSGGHDVGPTGGEISPVQNYSQNTNTEWFISIRREIEWDPACEAGSIAVLQENRDPLGEMTDLQRSLMIVNGIFGLAILGILFSVLYLVQYFDDDRDMACIPGKGTDELKNLDRAKEIIGLIAKIAKFVPLVLCLLVTDRIANFFLTAAGAQCSDATTNATLIDVGNQVERVRDSNYQTLAIDIAMFLLQFILWGWEAYKKRDGDDDGSNEKKLDDEEGELELEDQYTKEVEVEEAPKRPVDDMNDMNAPIDYTGEDEMNKM